MLTSARGGRVLTLPPRAKSQLKYWQQWFIPQGDVLRDDRIIGGLRTIDGMGRYAAALQYGRGKVFREQGRPE